MLHVKSPEAALTWFFANCGLRVSGSTCEVKVLSRLSCDLCPQQVFLQKELLHLFQHSCLKGAKHLLLLCVNLMFGILGHCCLK